jgi:hypothetical protein
MAPDGDEELRLVFVAENGGRRCEGQLSLGETDKRPEYGSLPVV